MSWYSGSSVEGPTLSVIGWHTGTIGKIVFFLGLALVVIAILREAGIELPPSIPESLVTIALGSLATVLVLIRLISIPDTFAGTSGRSIGLWIASLGARGDRRRAPPRRRRPVARVDPVTVTVTAACRRQRERLQRADERLRPAADGLSWSASPSASPSAKTATITTARSGARRAAARRCPRRPAFTACAVGACSRPRPLTGCVVLRPPRAKRWKAASAAIVRPGAQPVGRAAAPAKRAAVRPRIGAAGTRRASSSSVVRRSADRAGGAPR